MTRPAMPARPAAIDPQTGLDVEASGLRRFVSEHPRAIMATAIALVFSLAATCAFLVGMATAATPIPLAGPGSVVEPVTRAQPATLGDPRALRTCSVTALAEDPSLGSLRATVTDANSGRVLYSRQGSKPVEQASVTKVLTGVAAIATLGADRRLSTTVFEGSEPGSIVIVGGGDPTLSRRNTGESFYQGASKISALAADAVAAYSTKYPGTMITSVIVDATLWNPDDNWLDSWSADNRALGYQSKVAALQVDGDRDDPRERVSPRSDDPVGRAADAFAKEVAAAAGIPVPSISYGAVNSSEKLAEVQSQPVSTLVGQMISTSDGAIAESLARLVSLELGMDGSSESVKLAIPAGLERLGIDSAKVVTVDGSGLSAKNAIAPEFVAALMKKVREGKSDLTFVYNALAIAGETGGLAKRFTGDSAKASGKVFAKIGRISSSLSLAGIIEAEDGTLMAFSFVALKDGITESSIPALDALAAGVYSCGSKLAAG